MPAPALVPLNIFAIWLTTRSVVAPAFACADPGVLRSGEKNGEGSFGTEIRLVLVNGTNCRSVISAWVCSYALVEVWKGHPLTPLRTRVVRVARWMTASASCVCGKDRVERMERVSIGWC